VWDSFFGADLLDVNTAQWLGTACAAPTVNGVPEVDITHMMGVALSGTAAQIVAAFVKFFDKASPTGTVNSLPDAVQARRVGCSSPGPTRQRRSRRQAVGADTFLNGCEWQWPAGVGQWVR